MTETESQFIDVDALCVGMFIYLDLGWIGHPFALNSFKIVSTSQIETIRGLGLTRLRWSPAKSELPQPESPAAAAAPVAVLSVVEERRKRLLAQQLSLERCDRDFSEATRAFRDILTRVRTDPAAARARAETMVGALVDNLLDQSESFIRLLSEKAGEQSSLHAINVTLVSLLLGRRLGFDSAALQCLGLGALLHDIGKLELPNRLRWREEGFTTAERNLYKQHVAEGVEVSARMGLPDEVRCILAQHHEHADGSGFPQRLSGDALTPAAAIVALVNYYDNLCNPSNPLAAMTPHQALSLIFAQSRAKFEAKTLETFIRMMGVYPPGSVVMLTDDRYALVVSVSASRPLKPRVLIYDPRVPREEALVVDLEAHPDLGIRQSLKPVQLPRATFDYLSPRQRMCYFFERARDPAEGREGV
ncbi:HD domain-containing phosphohydrolase [Thiocystis violacea]|uniref:HD domain-containing phosphohydrolase n=1 Tax=Thiocystis violacea TaxID=13725 RepID=UPI0019041812|nr:phosphohydrolase [Thiocystis violacea]